MKTGVIWTAACAVAISATADVELSTSADRVETPLSVNMKRVGTLAPRSVKGGYGAKIAAVQKAVDAASVAEKNGVSVKKGVRYLGEGRKETLDIYLPANGSGGRVPGIVVIHGGGWRIGDKGDGRERNICRRLADAGYVCVSIDYLLCDGIHATWPTNILDCKTAVQWLRVNADRLNVDPLRIGCIGSSAGGHLCALLATTGDDVCLRPKSPYGDVDVSVQACVNLYGAMDPFHLSKKDRWLKSFAAMVGCSADEGREIWLNASPLHRVSAKTCPMLQVHGDADETVDIEQMYKMKVALDAAGVENESLVVPGIGHTFSLDASSDGKPLPKDVRGSVVKFFDRCLKGREGK
jgi:acetyl esterase/lipase